jgi:hypothetical protein
VPSQRVSKRSLTSATTGWIRPLETEAEAINSAPCEGVIERRPSSTERIGMTTTERRSTTR